VQSKDVFQAFYNKNFAKRLLLSSSSSIEAEKAMIARLKAECGPTFTKKMQGMYKDMHLSKDNNVDFSQQIASIPGCPAIDMTAMVLTTSYWPAYPPTDFRLPPDVKKLQDMYKTQYVEKHNGRQLQWADSLATCVLKANLSKGRKELAMGAAQACVLLEFNEAGPSYQLTFKQIKDSSRMETEELKRALQSLACCAKGQGGVNVLLKKPKGLTVSEEDMFMVNKKLVHPLFRIKIPIVEAPEAIAAEDEATTKKVFRDRQFAIDANIVRIMKSRKTMSHPNLMAEVLSQIPFPTKPAEIKARIASLIERDYLERDKDQSNVYNYQA
jgi:cullin-4